MTVKYSKILYQLLSDIRIFRDDRNSSATFRLTNRRRVGLGQFRSQNWPFGQTFDLDTHFPVGFFFLRGQRDFVCFEEVQLEAVSVFVGAVAV